MISLIIPVGIFPFLAKACLLNIAETANLDEIDLIFVMNPGEERVKEELKKHNLKFRIIECPRDYNYLHMKMLDYCVRRANITDWFIVQHADLFWHKPNWLELIKENISKHPQALAFAPIDDFIFRYNKINNDEKIITLHDYFGVYYKPQLLKDDLSFLWGKKKELNWSYPTKKNIENNNIIVDLLNEIHFINENSYIDGSKLITLEYAARFPGRTHFIKGINQYFTHLSEIFRKAYTVKIVDNFVSFNVKNIEQYSYYQYGCYSYFCTHFFEKDDFQHKLAAKPLPWNYFELLNNLDFDFKKVKQNIYQNLNRLKKYSDKKEINLFPEIKGAILNGKKYYLEV